MAQMFEGHAGVAGAELPVDAGLGCVARGQGLPRQDAQFRFGPAEPTTVPGRKHPLYALGPAARLDRRKSPV